jgi:hypothetical protein
MAKNRAFSATESPCDVESWRKIRVHMAKALSPQNSAMAVWSGVLIEPVAEPNDFTWSNSAAYAALPSRRGPSVANIEACG